MTDRPKMYSRLTLVVTDTKIERVRTDWVVVMTFTVHQKNINDMEGSQ